MTDENRSSQPRHPCCGRMKLSTAVETMGIIDMVIWLLVSLTVVYFLGSAVHELKIENQKNYTLKTNITDTNETTGTTTERPEIPKQDRITTAPALVSENTIATTQNTIPENTIATTQNTIPDETSTTTQNPIPENTIATTQNTIPENTIATTQNPIPVETSTTAQNTVSGGPKVLRSEKVGTNQSSQSLLSENQNVGTNNAAAPTPVSKNQNLVTKASTPTPVSENQKAITRSRRDVEGEKTLSNTNSSMPTKTEAPLINNNDLPADIPKLGTTVDVKATSSLNTPHGEATAPSLNTPNNSRGDVNKAAPTTSPEKISDPAKNMTDTIDSGNTTEASAHVSSSKTVLLVSNRANRTTIGEKTSTEAGKKVVFSSLWLVVAFTHIVTGKLIARTSGQVRNRKVRLWGFIFLVQSVVDLAMFTASLAELMETTLVAVFLSLYLGHRLYYFWVLVSFYWSLP